MPIGYTAIKALTSEILISQTEWSLGNHGLVLLIGGLRLAIATGAEHTTTKQLLLVGHFIRITGRPSGVSGSVIEGAFPMHARIDAHTLITATDLQMSAKGRIPAQSYFVDIRTVQSLQFHEAAR